MEAGYRIKMKMIGKSGKRGRESEAEMKWLVKEGKEKLGKKRKE